MSAGIGNAIKEARLRRGVTVAKAANQAGMHRTTWKRIEDGKHVNDVTVQTALDYLGLDRNAITEPAPRALTRSEAEAKLEDESTPLRRLLRIRAEIDRVIDDLRAAGG